MASLQLITVCLVRSPLNDSAGARPAAGVERCVARPPQVSR